MVALVVPIIVILLYGLLLIYFAYTVIAIFKGAAPIPSRKSTIEKMLRLSNIRRGEKLVDLGSGDGRILFAASKRGACCLGIEINPLLCWYTRVLIWLKKDKLVSVQRGDFWKHNLRDVDILAAYAVPRCMQKLKTKVQNEMQPGSKVIVAVYPFPDWPPEQQDDLVYLYRV